MRIENLKTILLVFPVVASLCVGPGYSKPKAVVYQHPRPGSQWNSRHTTIILRLNKDISLVHEKINFTIIGNESGNHLGRIQWSDDGRTITYIPIQPFHPGEVVTATVNAPSLEIDLTWSFEISHNAVTKSPIETRPTVSASWNETWEGDGHGNG